MRWRSACCKSAAQRQARRRARAPRGGGCRCCTGVARTPAVGGGWQHARTSGAVRAGNPAPCDWWCGRRRRLKCVMQATGGGDLCGGGTSTMPQNWQATQFTRFKVKTGKQAGRQLAVGLTQHQGGAAAGGGQHARGAAVRQHVATVLAGTCGVRRGTNASATAGHGHGHGHGAAIHSQRRCAWRHCQRGCRHDGLDGCHGWGRAARRRDTK